MGMLFPAKEALRIGLVDEVAESPERLRQMALERLDGFLKVPGRWRTDLFRRTCEVDLTTLPFSLPRS